MSKRLFAENSNLDLEILYANPYLCPSSLQLLIKKGRG